MGSAMSANTAPNARRRADKARTFFARSGSCGGASDIEIDVDVDRARVPDHAVDHGRTEQLPGTRAVAGSQHHLRDVLGPGEVEQRLRHVPPDHFVERPAHHLDELPGRLERGELLRAFLGDHVHGEQLAAATGRDARRAADQRLILCSSRDTDDDPLPCLPRTLDLVVVHVVLQRLIDPVRDPQERQLAQRAKVAFAEVVRERRVDLLGGIDVAVRHPSPQRERSHVDELHLVGGADDLVGDRLALLHAGDALDDVVQRLQVLHVHGGDHVDPRLEDLVHVLPTFLVARSGDVRVRELVDQHDLRRPGHDRVDVHLLERRVPMSQRAAGHDLEVREALERLRTTVRLDEAHDHVSATLVPAGPLTEHGERLPDAGRVAEVDAERAASHAAPRARRSSARLSSSTLTLGSPRTPNVRPSVCRAISASTSSTANPLAAATLDACNRA